MEQHALLERPVVPLPAPEEQQGRGAARGALEVGAERTTRSVATVCAWGGW